MSCTWRGVSSATDESSLNISLLLITRCCGTAANGSWGPCGGKTGWATLRARSADSGRVRCFFAVIRREVIRVYVYMYTCKQSTYNDKWRAREKRWNLSPVASCAPVTETMSGCWELPSLNMFVWQLTSTVINNVSVNTNEVNAFYR